MFSWAKKKLEHFSDGYSNAPIAIFIQQYFPVDIIYALQIRRNYIRFIKNVKKEIGQNKYNPLWLSEFRRIFELSQQKGLSQSLFNSGLEIIQKSMNESTEPLPIDTTVPAELSRWIKYAKKHEIDEGCVLQQFRIAFYKGILQVTRNKITPDEWIKNLSTHKDSLPKKISGEIFQLLEDFNERYFSWVEQDAYTFYEVPVLVYQKFFSAIEEEIANYNVVEIEEEVGSEPDPEETDIIPTTEQVKNFFSYINESVKKSIGTFRKALKWASNHKKNIFLWWLAASSRSVVNAQSTDPFLTVLSGSNALLSPSAVQQTNDSHLWVAGLGIFSPALDEDFVFGEVANGTLLSTIRFGGIGHDLVRNIIQGNNSIMFSGWSSPTTASYYRSVIGKVVTDTKALSWYTVYGGANNDIGRGVVETNMDYRQVGQTKSFGAGGYDGTLVAVNKTNGALLFTKTVGESGDENLVFLINTMDGNNAATGFTTSFTAGGQDVIVCKFDTSGNLLWMRKLGGINNDIATSIVEKSNGNLVIVGSTQSFGAVGKDVLIIELDNLGNLVSAHRLGGNGDEEAKTVQKTNNGVKLAGYTTSYGTGNPSKMFIVDKYSNNTVLAITIEGSDNDVIYEIKPKSNGGYTFTGTYNQSAVVGESDSNGFFDSNCTTYVTPSIIDITNNITVSTPNITAVPYTPTIFNVTFTNSLAPLISENPCSFPIPTTTSSATIGNPTTSVVATSSSATSFTPTTSSQGSTSSDGNGPTTLNPSSSSSGSTVNVIAVVGGVAGAVLLLGFGAYLKRRKSGNKINDTDNNGSDSESRVNVPIDESVKSNNDKKEIIYNTVNHNEESIYNTVTVNQEESIYNTMDGSVQVGSDYSGQVEEGKRTSASRRT